MNSFTHNSLNLNPNILLKFLIYVRPKHRSGFEGAFAEIEPATFCVWGKAVGMSHQECCSRGVNASVTTNQNADDVWHYPDSKLNDKRKTLIG